MYRKTESRHVSNYSFTSPLDLSRRVAIRRRLIESKRRTEQSQESQAINTTQSIRNTVSTISRPINNDENNSLISNIADNNNNKMYITSTPSKIKKSRRRKYSMHLSEKNELNKIEEEKPKEENINSEIKDTVRCCICLGLVTKPKMCQFCHRIACEKCLYNWFINLKKEFCGFCREKINFNQMVSVPFMEKVVNFVDKFFNKKKYIRR